MSAAPKSRRKDRPRKGKEEAAGRPDDAQAASAAPGAHGGHAATAAEPVADSPPQPPLTLAIDIGGTGIKCMLVDGRGVASGARRRQATPNPATPDAILGVIRGLLPDTHYDRVSIGFPGVVVEGVTKSAPNLHPSWSGFTLQRAVAELTGRPVRVLNDAGVQGYGVIKGSGTEIVVTLGTGMGFALYLDGRYVPNIELAHHPLTRRRTYEERVGNAARREVGNRRWQKRVVEALEQIQRTFNPHAIYVGGGNAERLTVDLPDNVHRVSNIAGLLGGVALWRVHS